MVNIAVAYGRQNKEQEASEYLVDAKKYSEDCSAFHHAIYGYLIQSNKEDAETLYQGLKNKNPQSIFQAKLKPLHVFLLDGNKLPKSLQYLVH
jgi:hypothetical protein